VTTINLLVNHGIPTGWTDALPWLNLTNQQPHGFHTHISVPGEELDSADSYTGPDDTPVVTTATVVPECVHIHKGQLPADEQPGAENALILEGEWVYKVFAGAGSFSQDTYAWVRAPAKGMMEVAVPVQVHYNPNPGGDGSPGAAVWRLWMDDRKSEWYTFGDGFTDREWWWKEAETLVTAGQVVTIRLQVESRSEAGIDFFTDLEAWRADFTPDAEPLPGPEPEPCRGTPRLQYARVVNVVPADATPERFLDIAEIAWDAGRQTVTGSYDDAGIGDLDDRTAVLWDIPADERYDYGVFFDAYYPGVTVIFRVDGAPTPDPEPDPPPDPDPEPEPPPDPTWKPHNYVPTGTKLGWHAIGDAGQSTLFRDLLPYQACPPSVKFVVDVGPSRLIKAIAPNTKVIGRFIDGPGGNYEGFNSDVDLQWQANHRLAQLMPLWKFHRHNVDYWEFINEQDPPGTEGQAKLARYSIYAMDVAEANGYKLALFSHSTGVPEPPEWDAMADTGVFERAAAGGHCLSLHEYGEWPIDLHSHLARYRDVYERIILPWHLDLPCYITEHAAWVHLLDRGPDWLWSQLVEYDRELRKDPYVAGAHIYSVGPGPTWYNDCYVAIYPRFINYCIEQRDVPNA